MTSKEKCPSSSAYIYLSIYIRIKTSSLYIYSGPTHTKNIYVYMCTILSVRNFALTPQYHGSVEFMDYNQFVPTGSLPTKRDYRKRTGSYTHPYLLRSSLHSLDDKKKSQQRGKDNVKDTYTYNDNVPRVRRRL